MTTTKEDYIIEIYRLERKNKLVSNKQLSTILNISAPSVTEMLNVLEKEGYIKYFPYKGSTLTNLGKKRAKAVLHNHHVWEEFLMKCLNYNSKKAHIIAHELEHVTSEDLVNRLELFLETI